MGKITSTTVMHSNGTLTSDEQQRETGVSLDGDIALLHYAYGPALLPQPSDLRRGMWRYHNLLPLEDGPILYPLSVGETPLVASQPLRTFTHLPHLWLKDETKTTTGSNKDRATALVLEHALRQKIDVVTCASTGNVAVSLAVGAAAAGMKAVIFVSSTVSDIKLRMMLLTGANVIKVAGGYDAAFALSRRAAQRFGWCDRNTGVNPLTLEAKKTVALEIWEQLGRRVPAAVVVPVGDGITLSAIAKGFRELKACGATQHIPRLIGVQAAGCQPLKQAWENDATTISAHPTFGDTIADGIAVGVPSGAALALHDVRESKGAFVAVPDHELLRAIQILAQTTGILAEPAAVAALAGLKPALKAGFLAPQEEIVIHITGSGFKAPAYLLPTKTALERSGDEKDLDDLLDALV